MEFGNGFATGMVVIGIVIAIAVILLAWSTRDPRRRHLSWFLALVAAGAIAMVVLMLAGPAAFLLFELT